MITYAGVELCYEDPDGQITAWIDRFLPLDDLRDQAGPQALRSQRPASRSDYQPGVNLPLPNYPEPPRPKLSTLYWPSGAARWARAYLLCTGTQLTPVLTATADNAPADLVFKDQDANQSIAARMYLLPPRNLSATDGGDDSLYLLPLVDRRYFWQFAESGALKVTRESAWLDVFGQLQTQLGVSFATDPIASSYAIPDPDELTRPFENAALLLDAAARSVGLTVVADLNGSISLLSWQTSVNRYEANVFGEQPPTRVAGGDFSNVATAGVFPEKVRVTFQKYREGAVDPNGDLWNVDVTGESLAFSPAFAPGLTKLVHSTAFADFTSKGAGPDNAAEVNELAQQIAIDYYDSLELRYDAVAASIWPWAPTGFDDHVEWILGRLNAGCYQAQTRVQSLPYNFGEEEQLSQFADKPVYPSPTRFTLEENLIPEPDEVGSAMAVHRKFNPESGQYEDTSDNLTIYDSLKAHPGLDQQTGFAAYKGDSLRWEAIELDNRFLPATLDADLPAGGTSTATIAGAGVSVPVTNWPTNASGQAGDHVYIRWESASQIWYTWPTQTPDESIITTWPYPPIPPDGPDDPVLWTSGMAIALALLPIPGYATSTAQLVRGNPLAGGARANPILTTGQPITVQNFRHPVMAGELIFVAAMNPKNIPMSQRFWVTGSEYEGHFVGFNTGGLWAKATSKLVLAYGGLQGAEVPQSGNPGLPLGANVFNRYGDIPDGKWFWVESDPWGWYVTSAEC